jgi:hypothetical protein
MNIAYKKNSKRYYNIFKTHLTSSPICNFIRYSNKMEWRLNNNLTIITKMQTAVNNTFISKSL